MLAKDGCVHREHRLGSANHFLVVRWSTETPSGLNLAQPATHPTRMTDRSKHTKPDTHIPERAHTKTPN